MSEQKRVWVVEQGEYSGRRIVGIFSTEKGAEEYAATFSQSRYNATVEITEYPLEEGFDNGCVYWHISFYPNRYRGEEGVSAERSEELPKGAQVGLVERVTNHYWRDGYYQDEVWVHTPTEEGAIKIAAEKVAQFRAEREGIA